ncbi:C40 family peptidase [Actinomadura welshii]|uniref:C40 family peptidase n=1 Tax=Actinomadura welshii TaxID=3103817 RepID=UPI0003AD716C|nr:C40 family peptidase [Actinomadura madurae]
MLRRIRSAGRPGNDAGVATSVLVMGMAVALAAGFLAFGRIAQAGDMRNQAQIGADAAALGTLAPLRDQAVDMLLQGIEPSAAGYWLVGAPPKSAAEKYADENDVHTTDVRLSGTLGNTAMVKVATDRCQLKNKDELTEKEKDDLRHKRNLCTDSRGKKGIGRSGTAQAIAKMFAPDCEYIAAPPTSPEDTGIGGIAKVICDGNVQAFPNGNRERVTKLFKIRLVDDEDPIEYNGLPNGLGPSGGGGVVASKCAKTGDKPAENLSFGGAVVAWALCWLGTPYAWGGGNTSGPTRGICCSPGGYDGRLYFGFDCSGLTLYAVYQASKGRIALGHYTGNQVADPRGVPVPTNALQAGDLLFFGQPPHHVAIYYGDGKMVEAPQTGDVVKISPLRSVTSARRFG